MAVRILKEKHSKKFIRNCKIHNSITDTDHKDTPPPQKKEIYSDLDLPVGLVDHVEALLIDPQKTKSVQAFEQVALRHQREPDRCHYCFQEL